MAGFDDVTPAQAQAELDYRRQMERADPHALPDDPATPQATPEPTGIEKGRGLARSVGRGLTFGGQEFAAPTVAAGIAKGRSMLPKAMGGTDPVNFSDAWSDIYGAEKEQQEQFEEHEPFAAAVAEEGAGYLIPGVAGVKLLNKARKGVWNLGKKALGKGVEKLQTAAKSGLPKAAGAKPRIRVEAGGKVPDIYFGKLPSKAVMTEAVEAAPAVVEGASGAGKLAKRVADSHAFRYLAGRIAKNLTGSSAVGRGVHLAAQPSNRKFIKDQLLGD